MTDTLPRALPRRFSHRFMSGCFMARSEGKKAMDQRAARTALGEGEHFLDLAELLRTPLVVNPFPHLVVPGFIRGPMRPSLAAAFPTIEAPGSFAVADLQIGAVFRRFLAELEGVGMRDAIAEKFGIDLAGRPTMITVRGAARAGDGQIHTDTRTKLITVLIYMNESWESSGGRLRLLRSPDNLDDVVTEVPPAAGTLLAFRVTPHSWHGHAPATGPRRVVQLNWVTSAAVVRRERLRHGLATRVKRLLSLVRSANA
jgi:SM-20-related protein